eukprot:9180422-Heterocapsa_arctica.AAC.1
MLLGEGLRRQQLVSRQQDAQQTQQLLAQQEESQQRLNAMLAAETNKRVQLHKEINETMDEQKKKGLQAQVQGMDELEKRIKDQLDIIVNDVHDIEEEIGIRVSIRTCSIEDERVEGYKMPLNIWGAVILTGLCVRRRRYPSIAVFLALLLALLASASMQYSFIIHVNTVVVEMTAECPADLMSVASLCLFVFLGEMMLKDVDETISMFLFQLQTINPKFPEGKKLVEGTGKDSTGFQHFDMKDYGIPCPGQVSWYGHGLIFITLLSKLWLGLSIAYAGTGYIVYAPTKEDVLLNS